jgi:CheY-like chemotaxis protein
VEAEKQQFTGRVLLVEDTFINQLVAPGVLVKFGLTPDLPDNDEIAIEMVKENEYDIILMDIQMPIMDGFESTAAIRQFESMSDRPASTIIAMTAHALQGDRERCLEQGMDDYIAKPVRQETIELTLQKWLSSNRAEILLVDASTKIIQCCS